VIILAAEALRGRLFPLQFSTRTPRAALKAQTS